MPEPLRVAVIGAGAIATAIHLPTLLALPDVTVSGILSRTPERAAAVARRFGIERVYDHLGAVTRDEADGALVLSPKETHADISIQLMRQGVDVFCEKPMATRLADAGRMLEASRATGRTLMVGFNRRYAPCYVRAREHFQAARPDVAVAEKHRPGTEYRATLENAIHMVDLLRWFCGEAVAVDAAAQFTDPYHETSCTAHLRFDGGAIGVLVANRSAGQWVERLALYGGGRTVQVEAPEHTTVLYPDREERVASTPLAMGWATVQDRFGFQAEVVHFVECLREGRPPRTSAEDAYRTHELMDRILRAAGLPAMDT